MARRIPGTRLLEAGVSRRALGRGLLGLGGLGALAALGSRPARASAADRRFLFLFCNGGWDTSRLFTPMDQVPGAEREEGAVVSEVGGLSLVDHPSRPLTRAWFQAYAERACVINGIEVRSVAHERCRRMVLTPDSGDDWPTLIAANSSSPLTLPHVVLSGPNYTAKHADRVVRVGDDGQLLRLLNGEAQALSARPVPPLGAEVELLADQLVRSRAGVLAAGDHRGAQAFGDAYARSLDSLGVLATTEGLSLEPQLGVCSRDVTADTRSALSCFELGLSRTAMVQYNAFCDESWDSHTNLEKQSLNYEELFGYLDQLMLDLDSRGLSDQVTVVVFSEMGRHPMLNNWGGKDHWTYTSAMLIGAGVQGGQMIGALDESAMGRAVDPVSGGLDDAGESLLPDHLGATLLALAGLDPVAVGVDAPVIEAVLAG